MGGRGALCRRPWICSEPMPKKQSKSSIKVLRKELLAEDRILTDEIRYIKKHLDKIWEHVSNTNERLQDLEVQMNLLSRLVAALAVEKLNMRTFSLMKMIKRIEKQAIADAQISHLENLYRLEHPKLKKPKEGGA